MKTAPKRPRKENVLPPHCPECGHAAPWIHTPVTQAQEFRGKTLQVKAPLHQCSGCGFSLLTTEDATTLFHATVEAWQEVHDLMTAREIREARQRRGWSQAKLAGETGLGIATVKRLESGGVVQTDVNDYRLREALGSAADPDCVIVFADSVGLQTEWQPDDMDGEGWKYGTMTTWDDVKLDSSCGELCSCS